MNFNTKVWHWIILLILALIWGSSFILMKRGLEAFDDTQVAALRIFIAFLCLLPFALGQLQLMIGKKWLALLASGLFGNFIPAFLYTKAETELPSSIVGMLSSLTPLFTLLIGLFIFKIKIKWFNIIGVIIGFAGAFGLILTQGNSNFTGNIYFTLYVVLATIMYAISVNVTKTHLQEINSVHITSISMMFVGPIAGFYLFTTDFTEKLTQHPMGISSLGYISILAILGTAISVIIFNLLIKMTSAVFASMVTYVIPVFALSWGILDGETISIQHFLWIVIVFIGIFLVNKKKSNSDKNQAA